MTHKIIFPVLALAIALWYCGPCEGCQEMADKQEALNEREAALEEREAALAQREAALDAAEDEETVEDDSMSTEGVITPGDVVIENDPPIRLGSHNITLQWISWDHPGTAEVSFVNKDLYKIVGEQRSKENDDFLRIDGTLRPQDERTFLFDGRIEYQVSHNNGGEVCVKTGPLHFKASGTRKYWRLQEKTNCEGGMLTDYIDIYF